MLCPHLALTPHLCLGAPLDVLHPHPGAVTHTRPPALPIASVRLEPAGKPAALVQHNLRRALMAAAWLASCRSTPGFFTCMSAAPVTIRTQMLVNGEVAAEFESRTPEEASEAVTECFERMGLEGEAHCTVSVRHTYYLAASAAPSQDSAWFVPDEWRSTSSCSRHCRYCMPGAVE